MLSNLRRQLLLSLNIIILQFSLATAALAQGMPVVVQAAKDADWQTLHTLLDDGLQKPYRCRRA